MNLPPETPRNAIQLDRINRIDRIIRLLPFRLPAIARRSDEADGDERQKTLSAFTAEIEYRLNTRVARQECWRKVPQTRPTIQNSA